MGREWPNIQPSQFGIQPCPSHPGILSSLNPPRTFSKPKHSEAGMQGLNSTDVPSPTGSHFPSYSHSGAGSREHPGGLGGLSHTGRVWEMWGWALSSFFSKAFAVCPVYFISHRGRDWHALPQPSTRGAGWWAHSHRLRPNE